MEGDGWRRLRGKAGGEAVPLEAAVNTAARQLGVEAAPHRLEDVIERQGEAAPQLDDQSFFPFTDRGGQAMRAGRAIAHVVAAFPARHGAAVDAELTRQRTIRGAAFLDVGADARGRGGIGVQLEIHQPASPSIALPRRRGRLAGTLAPVGPQGPPARRAAGLGAVAARSRGSLLWTTGTSCVCARNRRSFKKATACHNRAPSRQSSGTKHLRRGSV